MRGTPDKDDAEPLFAIEVEQAVLGWALLNNDSLSRMSGLLSEHFCDPVHGEIWDIIQTEYQAGRTVSPVSLRPLLASHEGLSALGGVNYLVRLAGAATSAVAIPEYVQILKSLWARRDAIAALDDARELLSNPSLGSSEDILAELEERLIRNREVGQIRPISVSLSTAVTESTVQMMETYQNGGEDGIKTGVEPLDRVLGDLLPGEVLTLGARPSMGKSAVAWHMAQNIAKSGHGVAFVTLEMPEASVVQRHVSARIHETGGKLPYSRMRRPADMTEDEARMLVTRAKQAADANLPIEIMSRAGASLERLWADIRAVGKKFKPDAPLKVIVLDHMGLVRVPKARSIFEETSKVSGAIKALALDMGVVVISLCQLNRKVEERALTSRRPSLADLRMSGDIEQDSDSVVFLYRHAYYLERELKSLDGASPEDRFQLETDLERCRHDIEFIVDKNRAGPLRTITHYIDLPHNYLRSRGTAAPSTNVQQADMEGF